MNVKMYAALLATLFVLGCTTSGGNTGSVSFSQTAGAVINDFTFDVVSVEDFNDRAVLTFGFQNVGGKTMEGETKAYIYGPAMVAVNTPNSSKKWKVENTGGGSLLKNRITWTLSDATFYAPDPQTGQPGMSQVSRVVLVPPNQDESMDNIRYTFEAALCYPYKTTSSSKIRAVAQNTYATVAATQSLAQTISSAGPIQLSLKAGENIRANAGAGGTTQLPIVIEARDVGGGFATKSGVPCDPLVGRAQIGVINATVFIDGTPADCGTGDVYIRNGVGNLYCTGTFATTNPKTEYDIVAQTTYKYYVTKSATLGVSDSRDSGDVDSA